MQISQKIRAYCKAHHYQLSYIAELLVIPSSTLSTKLRKDFWKTKEIELLTKKGII
jgi:hypothetical protein